MRKQFNRGPLVMNIGVAPFLDDAWQGALKAAKVRVLNES
jgi:hypothetical protein